MRARSFSPGFLICAQKSIMKVMIKKNYFSIIFFINLLYVMHINGIVSAVTYTFSGGRFGDNLVAYCHAQWIAYKYKIPLLYKPFEYSDQLMMHLLETSYSEELEQQFNQVVAHVRKDSPIDPEKGNLHEVHFFPEDIFIRSKSPFPFFVIDWHNQGFKELLQKMICPINPIKKPIIPEGYMSIALHVRKGTGWDIPCHRMTPQQLTAHMPGRFAPDSFYINALTRLIDLFPDNNLYVYLFTDHDKPAELVQKYQQAVNCERMTFDYRKEENNEYINVLEDFFAMTYFDCLIRAESHFSIIASKLGDYKVVISPYHGVIKGETVFIDKINLELDGISSIIVNDFV